MVTPVEYSSQKDSCIQMGSNESNFNVSFIVRDKVTRHCPQTTACLKRKESRSPSASVTGLTPYR